MSDVFHRNVTTNTLKEHNATSRAGNESTASCSRAPSDLKGIPQFEINYVIAYTENCIETLSGLLGLSFSCRHSLHDYTSVSYDWGRIKYLRRGLPCFTGKHTLSVWLVASKEYW